MGYDKYNRTLSAARLEGRQGVYSYGVPVLPAANMVFKGDVFHVDSGHANADDTGTGKDPARPLKKIDTAIGKCAANNGDLILVSEGHAETVTGAAGIALDVAGVTILGLGSGEARPVVTFGTAVGASFDVSAANCRVENLLFKNNIDSQTAVLNTSGKDFTLYNCEFREGAAKQFLIGVNIGAANNDSDRCKVYNCTFTSASAGAASAIKLANLQDGVELVGNTVFGDFSDAGVHNPAAEICTNLLIADNTVSNLNTGNHAIELVSACTGILAHNYLYADTEAAILDPGSLKCIDNWASDAIDAPSFAVPPTATDTAANMIGADNANNDAATTLVVANKDGSVLERLEDITQELSGTGGIATFPAGVAAANMVSLAEVLRYIQDQVINGTGTVLAANTSLWGALAGATGIPTFPAGAAAANDVSLAEVLRYIQDQLINGTGTVLEANSSLFGVLAGATGVATFPAAAAPANGVSLAEVLRSIYDRQLGDGTNAATNGLLGKRIDRATADVQTGAAVPIFTVATGRVLLTSLHGKVTTLIGGGANNAKFQFNPTTGSTNDMCANLDIDADEAGALYSLTGLPTDAMLRSESGAVRNITSAGIILDVGDIEFITASNVTGSISFQAWYIPLDNGATLAAA